MKKWFCILLVLVGAFILTSYNVPYSIKCYKCAKTIGSSASGIRAIAWRTFEECASDCKESDFVQYKCEHGHKLYVNYLTKEKK